MLLLVSLCIGFATTSEAADDAVMVYGTPSDHGFNLSFSRRTGDQWSAPEQLTDTRQLNFLPVVGEDNTGNAWVVWTRLQGPTATLYFRYQVNGVWQPEAAIETGNGTNMAPSLILDRQNTPWLVWSGNDGQDDDIWFSRWEGSQWDAPQQVNTDNDTPDILPVISLTASGYPQVTWQGFDGKKYVDYVSKWDGEGWVAAGSRPLSSERHQPDLAAVYPLPGFANNPQQASIALDGAQEAINIRKRISP